MSVFSRLVRSLVLVGLVACGGGGHSNPDASEPDSAGSNAHAAAQLEVSPHDVNLELAVLGIAAVVVIAPARRRKQ